MPNHGRFQGALNRKAATQGNRVDANGHTLSPRLPATSIAESDYFRVVALAERRGVPLAAIVRDAVVEYLADFAPPPAEPRADEPELPFSESAP